MAQEPLPSSAPNETGGYQLDWVTPFELQRLEHVAQIARAAERGETRPIPMIDLAIIRGRGP